MEVEGSTKIDNEIKADPLMDDNQFSENKGEPNDNELTGAVSAEIDADMASFKDAKDGLPELHESAEPERTKKNGRYNLRKSLAWDSAFFTNAGFLDPEELSSMITGPDKGGKHLLPGIEEDISGSTESISTLQSDNLTLESLEDDLFLDIRASIQRSSKRASNLTCSSSKPTVVEVDSAAISSLKKEDIVSQNKNTKTTLKKTSSLQPVRMSKCQPKQNTEKPGTGKTLRQDSGQSQMRTTVKVGESKLMLPKPPKGISRTIPTSTETTKRDSVGTGRVKSECGPSKLAAVPNKNTQPAKVSVFTGARRALPKPAPSSKSSSLVSSSTSRLHSTRSSVSIDTSSCISSETTAKSPLMTARRKPVINSKVGTATSASIPKTPSRAALKNKAPSSTPSSYLMSAKMSSSVSPASSISEWSSASSSSSMVNQRSLDTSSCRSVDSDIILSDLRCHSADQIVEGHENQGAGLPGNDSKKSSMQAGGVQGPMRPSGLRMPSPKIGFFDGVKSSGRTPIGPPESQSSLHAVFRKSGTASSSPTSNTSIKLKSGKAPTARTEAASVKKKTDSPKAKSPASFQKITHASINDSCGSMVVIHSPSLSLEVSATGESCQKEAEFQVKDGIKQVVDSGEDLNVGVLNNEKVLNVCKSTETGDVKVAAAGSASDMKYDIQKGDEDDKEQNHLKNDPCPVFEANDKENDHVKCEGENLTGCNEEKIPKALSFPAKDSQLADARAPLALKNVFCDEECMDTSKESAITLLTSE